MPAEFKADTDLTAEGYLGFDVDPQQGNRPLRLRLALYAGGTGDDRKTWWTTVKFFPDAFDGDPEELTKGTRVRISEARIDGLWTNNKGQEQVDWLARKVEIAVLEDRSAERSAPSTRRRPATNYDETPF